MCMALQRKELLLEFKHLTEGNFPLKTSSLQQVLNNIDSFFFLLGKFLKMCNLLPIGFFSFQRKRSFELIFEMIMVLNLIFLSFFASFTALFCERIVGFIARRL